MASGNRQEPTVGIVNKSPIDIKLDLIFIPVARKGSPSVLVDRACRA